MNLQGNLRTPVLLLAVFVLVSAIPLAALAWFGWRSFEVDRAWQAQQRRERLDNAATLLVREIDRAFATWEDLLPAVGRGETVAAPPGTTVLVLDSHGVLRHQGATLPFYPHVSAFSEPPVPALAAAEHLEHYENNIAKAADSYRELAETKNAGLRAAALMGLARCLRKQGREVDAVLVHGELARMGATPVAGSPSEYVARSERIALFKKSGNQSAARNEAALLADALSAGRFVIDRPTFEFFSEFAPLAQPSADALQLADAVEASWAQWNEQPFGTTSLSSGGVAFASVWRRTSAGTAVILGPVSALVTSAEAMAPNLELVMVLEDSAGRPVWGSIPEDRPAVLRPQSETRLPWNLRVANASLAENASVSRRNLFAAGFGLMVAVIAAASYLVLRSIGQELRVARLQSDFISAVSHEFRTPLTAMRHLTEMLEEGQSMPERLAHYYRALGKETRRLHSMVESLLDFKRMEAGRRTYHLEEENAVALAASVVDEFRDNAKGPRVELHAPAHPVPIRADRDALDLALRNLVDNAIKYSPESTTVAVDVESENGWTRISVEDHGVGIPKHEQRGIFRKFVRGASAKTLNIKGTGIGLTMANQIVKAHGGRIELASEPGQGSRFTIVLRAVPVVGEAHDRELYEESRRNA
jgi:signal transduction histidine kinase